MIPYCTCPACREFDRLIELGREREAHRIDKRIAYGRPVYEQPRQPRNARNPQICTACGWPIDENEECRC